MEDVEEAISVARFNQNLMALVGEQERADQAKNQRPCEARFRILRNKKNPADVDDQNPDDLHHSIDSGSPHSPEEGTGHGQERAEKPDQGEDRHESGTGNEASSPDDQGQGVTHPCD